MSVFNYNYVVKTTKTSLLKVIFMITQRNQLMIPASSCIFSVFCNEEKSQKTQG